MGAAVLFKGPTLVLPAPPNSLDTIPLVTSPFAPPYRFVPRLLLVALVLGSLTTAAVSRHSSLSSVRSLPSAVTLATTCQHLYDASHPSVVGTVSWLPSDQVLSQTGLLGLYPFIYPSTASTALACAGTSLSTLHVRLLPVPTIHTNHVSATMTLTPSSSIIAFDLASSDVHVSVSSPAIAAQPRNDLTAIFVPGSSPVEVTLRPTAPVLKYAIQSPTLTSRLTSLLITPALLPPSWQPRVTTTTSFNTGCVGVALAPLSTNNPSVSSTFSSQKSVFIEQVSSPHNPVVVMNVVATTLATCHVVPESLPPYEVSATVRLVPYSTRAQETIAFSITATTPSATSYLSEMVLRRGANIALLYAISPSPVTKSDMLLFASAALRKLP